MCDSLVDFVVEQICEYRTVFDLGKSTEGVMKLEQETNHLNITFFLGLTPRVWLYCVNKDIFIILLGNFCYAS